MSKELNTVVKTGKTVEEAVQEGLKDLKASPEEVKIEVLSEAKGGFLGVFGAKDAVVRLSLKSDSYKDLLEKEKKEWDDRKKKTTHFEPIEKPMKKIPTAKKIVESQVPKNREEKKEGGIKIPAPEKEEVQPVKAPEEPAHQPIKEPEMPKTPVSKVETKEEESLRIEDLLKVELSKENFSAPLKEKKIEEPSSEENSPLKASIYEELKTEETPAKIEKDRAEELLEDSEPKSAEEKIRKLPEASLFDDEKNGKIGEEDLENSDFLDPAEVLSTGCQWLKEILTQMHIEAGVEGTEKDGNLYFEIVEISDSDTGIIIGRRGETLSALQYLLSVSLNHRTRDHYRIFVDVGAYRIRRKVKIEKMARRNAEKVQKTHRKMSLEPMNAYERRIVHTALQGMTDIVTVSEGRDPNRRVVIRYKG